MPVDSTHPQYDSHIEKQQKCRDAYEGEAQVKKQTVKYLPLLSGMQASGSKYQAYLSRAMFYSATRRTVEGLAGVVDRKPPTIEIADGLPWETDIDGHGISLRGFASQLTGEAVLIGWQGVLVDRRKDYDYPYPIQYSAEQIINWDFENGELQMVMLAEEVNERGEDYSIKSVKQWRELVLIEGEYTVILYRKNDKDEFIIHDFMKPTMRGDLLSTIPFVFVSSDNMLENPPLLDMVEVNFHHYKNSADYEHGLHFTGIPTPYIAGLQQPTDKNGDNIPVELGSETCLLLPEGGTAGFMEFSGKGLDALVTGMDNKKLEMASLGARLLQTEKKAVEAAETARINKSGDSNVISSIVTGVERALNTVLDIMSVWQAVNPESNSIELNRDFVDEGLSAQELTSIVGAVQGGTMSLETAVYNHKKNDMLADGRTVEEEINAIKSQAPNLNGGIDINDGDGDGE